MPAVPPTTSRLIVKRNGKAITSKIPRPTVVVDTREQLPFNLARFDNWIAGEVRAALPAGDYSIQGMEHLIALERKSLSDLVGTLMQNRERFIRMCELMSELRWKAIIVEATLEDVKSPYPSGFTVAHPNGVFGSLDAIEAKFGIPIIYTSQKKALAEEKAASWLSKHFTYWHLENAGLGRVLQEGDL